MDTTIEPHPDGWYVVVVGRRWRITDVAASRWGAKRKARRFAREIEWAEQRQGGDRG